MVAEVIVYRNPLEAAMWHAVMAGEFFPIIAGIVVFFAVFLSVNTVMVWKWGSWGKGAAQRSYGALAIGAVVGILTIWKMWV